MSRTGRDLDEISISIKEPTPAPDHTATAEAEETETAVAARATQTAVAKVTQTAVAARATQTAVAKVTQTAVAARATQTAVAKVTQTAVAARATQTAVAKVTQTAVAKVTQTAVAKVTQTAVAKVTQTAVAKVTQTAVAARATQTAVAETAVAETAVAETAVAEKASQTAVAATATAQASSTPTATPISSGHQADHTVKVIRGAMPPVAAPPGIPSPNQIIPASISVAAADWNAKMSALNKDLAFCFNTCPGNTDGYVATVKTVKANKNPDYSDLATDTDCGRLIACNKFFSEQATGHIREMTIIIESPAWRYNNKVHTNVYWTDVKPLDNSYEGKKCNTASIKCWRYISATMAHELGHSMGLPDFDEHNTLMNIPAIMNPAHNQRELSVTDADIEQLRQIYGSHTRH